MTPGAVGQGGAKGGATVGRGRWGKCPMPQAKHCRKRTYGWGGATRGICPSGPVTLCGSMTYVGRGSSPFQGGALRCPTPEGAGRGHGAAHASPAPEGETARLMEARP